MIRQIQFCNTSLEYSLEGSGPALVFLHGYLESRLIWEGFADRFSRDHTVICPDIPGHGNSGVIDEVHSMELMADTVAHILEHEGIRENVTLFGHSMGGYVTMAFVNKYPELVSGYCLFHSTCFADTDEKRLNRDREISLVKCGKKNQIVKTNIPKAFSDDHLDTFSGEISRCKEIALTATEEGIVALLKGMQNRSDHSKTLADGKIRPMIIWGERDNYIPRQALDKMLDLSPGATVLILHDSGHMGFIEESDCAYSGIMGYLDSLEMQEKTGK